MVTPLKDVQGFVQSTSEVVTDGLRGSLDQPAFPEAAPKPEESLQAQETSLQPSAEKPSFAPPPVEAQTANLSDTASRMEPQASPIVPPDYQSVLGSLTGETEEDVAFNDYTELPSTMFIPPSMQEIPALQGYESVLGKIYQDAFKENIAKENLAARPTPGTWEPKRVRHAERASGVNQSLLDVVSLAETYLPEGFELQVGHQGGKRKQAEQDALVKAGFSKTRKSYHLTGNALDLQPIVGGKNHFASHDMKYWGPVQEAMKRASKELGVPVEWGGDWKGSWDKPHWQIPRGWKSETS